MGLFRIDSAPSLSNNTGVNIKGAFSVRKPQPASESEELIPAGQMVILPYTLAAVFLMLASKKHRKLAGKLFARKSGKFGPL